MRTGGKGAGGRRRLGLAATTIFLFLIAGCETTFEASELRTGMAEREVVELMGPPVRRTELSMPGGAATRFAVLEYPLRGAGAWTPSPHWLLFDRDGLITFGPGGAIDARLRTVEAYYDWMAANEKMPRAAAERHIHAAFRQAYGAALNPAVDDYLRHRIAVMQRVDEGTLTPAQAEQAIAEKYAELSSGVLDLLNLSEPSPEGLDRAVAVAKLGATAVAPTRSAHPKAARRRGPACPAAPSAGVLRCF